MFATQDSNRGGGHGNADLATNKKEFDAKTAGGVGANMQKRMAGKNANE